MNADKSSYAEPIVNGTIKDVHGNEYEVVNGKVGRLIDPSHDRQEMMVDDRPHHSGEAGATAAKMTVEMVYQADRSV